MAGQSHMSIPSTLPEITIANGAFWEGAKRGLLVLPHCQRCGHAWYPPSPACPKCLSADVQFRSVSGNARLWSWVVFHRQYFKDFPAPYSVAYVELDTGIMLMSTVVNAKVEDLRCDMPLRAVFERLPNDVHVLQFEPA